MAKNRQHQWEPVPDSEDLVKCKKCGTEVTAIRARRGAGPCLWGEANESSAKLIIEPMDHIDQPVADFLTEELNKKAPEIMEKVIEEAIAETLPGIASAKRDPTKCDDSLTAISLSYPSPMPPIDTDRLPEHLRPIKSDIVLPQFPGPRLTDPPEYCNGCGKQLAILPLNSRLDMVACNNRSCALYRERIRMVTKSVERGKRNRAKG